MRNLLLFLLLSTAFGAKAQLWERAYQPSEAVHWDRALPVGGGRWAVIGGPTSAGSHTISVRNGDGSIAWEQVSPYGNDADFGQVVLMPDSGLLRAGLFDGCDYFGLDSQVRRYAPDGTLLWERIFISQDWAITMAAMGSIGHIALASQDSVYILDLDGNTVGGFEVPSGDLRKILWASDSTLFMVMGTELKLADLQGDELATTAIGPNVMDLHWGSQQLFVLANDGVRLFSPNLVPLGNNALTGLDGNSRFVVSASALYVNAVTGLYQLADDGTSSLLFSWPTLPNLTTTGCAVRNGAVLAVGNTNISGRRTGIIRTLSVEGAAAQHDQDVEVLLQVDSVWAEYVDHPCCPWNRKADLTGYVVNHGSDTLHSVVLSMWVQVPWILCEQTVNRIDTIGFALAPGDTISLPFGVVNVALNLAPSQVIDATGEICIVALAPDLLADRAPADNTACASVDFVLGVNEPVRNVSLSLAPNPATNTCVVSGLTALGASVRLRIMDPIGRIVTERSSNTSSNSLNLDVSGLPSGTYFLNAEGERSNVMMKLVIARP